MNGPKSSSADSGGGGVDQQASRMIEKLEAMKAEGRAAKRNGRIMAVLVAVVAIGGVYVLLRPMVAAYNNPKPYQEAFKSEMEKAVLPALQKESQEMLKAVGPDIMQAIRQDTAKRLPEITTKLESEAEKLATELTAEAKIRLAGRTDKLLNRLEASIAKAVPQTADSEKTEAILANGHKAAQNALDRFIQDYLKDHIDAVTNLQTRMEKFPVPPEVQKMTEDELRDHLTQTLGAYVMHHLSATGSPGMNVFMQAQGKLSGKEN